MISKALAMCAAAFIVASATATSAAPAYVRFTVNLRSGAGTNHDMVAKIPAGTQVESTSCAEGWCEVEWQDKKGFVIESALDTAGKAPPRRPPARRAAAPDGDEWVPMAPGYAYGPPPPPPVVYGPPPIYGYGPPPIYGPYWGWGYRRWGW